MLRKLISRMSGLTFIQGLATLIPLVVVPHLITHIGAAGFGLFSKALVISSLCIPFLDMGFDLHASRRMARKEGDPGALFGLQIQQKLFTMAPVFTLVFLLVRWVPDFREISLVLVFGLIYAAVMCLLPNWYFEGQQRFRIVQLSSLVWKLLYAGLVLSFVNDTGQEARVMAFNALGGLVIMAFFVWKMRSEGVRIRWSSWSVAWRQTRENSSLFVTPLTTYLVTFLPPMIVSLLITPVQFGYFSVVDRVLQVFRTPGNLLSTVVYVEYNKLRKEAVTQFQAFYHRVNALVAIAGGGAAVLLLLFEDQLLGLLTAGQMTEEGKLIYRILIWTGTFILQRQHLQKLIISLGREKRLATFSIIALGLMPPLFIISHNLGAYSGLIYAIVLYEGLFVIWLMLFSLRSMKKQGLRKSFQLWASRSGR